MKRLLIAGTLLALLWGCANPVNVETPIEEFETTVTRALPEGKSGDIIPDKYIVMFHSDDNWDPKERAEKVLGEHDLLLPEVVEHVFINTMKGFAGTIPKGKLKALKDDPAVDKIVPDVLVVINKRGGNSGKNPVSNTPPSQVVPWGVEKVVGTADQSPDPAKTLWIFDTGIDDDHYDLDVDRDKSFGRVPVRRRGRIIYPWDDDNGHGTHVAGTAVALDNEYGVIGVAPGANVAAVKVLDGSGSGAISYIMEGVDIVLGKTAGNESKQIINMSLGLQIPTDASADLLEAVDMLEANIITAADAGIRFTLAGGNDGQEIADMHTPSRIDHDNVYGVSAFGEVNLNGDITYEPADFSNYGYPAVDYNLPGDNILSLYTDDRLATASGTSMAAPHLAGILLIGDIIGTAGTLDSRYGPVAVLP